MRIYEEGRRRFVWEGRRTFVWKKSLALQKHFPYKSSKFSENSNFVTNLLIYARGLKPDHFAISDALFPFLTFFKL